MGVNVGVWEGRNVAVKVVEGRGIVGRVVGVTSSGVRVARRAGVKVAGGDPVGVVQALNTMQRRNAITIFTVLG
jgi:hypothetical protein